MEQLMSYIGTVLTWLLNAIAPNLPTNVQVAIVTLAVALIMYLYNRFVAKPKTAKANFNLGVVTGSQATIQEIQKPLAEGYEKSNEVKTAFQKAVNSPLVPQIDSKVEKAAKTMGGITSVIAHAVDILKLVSPIIFKKK